MRSRKYTKEFKQQAVKLSEDLGSLAEAAKQLGIPDANLHRWKKEVLTGQNLPQTGRVTIADLAAENARLTKENSQLKKVNLILKTAAAFFSQDHLK